MLKSVKKIFTHFFTLRILFLISWSRNWPNNAILKCQVFCKFLREINSFRKFILNFSIFNWKINYNLKFNIKKKKKNLKLKGL